MSCSQPGDDGLVHLPALIADAFGVSRGEARRLLAQGGVKLDGDAVERRYPRRAARVSSTGGSCRSGSADSHA